MTKRPLARSIMLIVMYFYLSALISSCVSPARQGSLANDDVNTSLAMQYIALDFVQAMLQVDQLVGRKRRILIEDVASDFGKSLADAMESVGLPLIRTMTDRGALIASYTVETEEMPDSKTRTSIRVFMDSYGFQRSYRPEDEILVPDSAFMIRGYDPEKMDMNDELFTMKYPQAVEVLAERFNTGYTSLADRLPETRVLDGR